MFSYSMNSLIVFHEVVKCGGFSKAAEALYMTQPGVSNHVSQLEVQTGMRLIKRDKGQFELTKEGKMVFRYSEKIDKMAVELENMIRGLKKDPKPYLRIGVTPAYSRILMPHMLGSFQRTNPDIKIKLDVGSSGEMVESVLTMVNDVVIVANPVITKKLRSFPLMKEELVLITAKNHPLSKLESVSLSELKNYPFIIREEGSATRKVVLSALSAMNISPSVLIEAKSSDFIKEWVSENKGISILIKRAVMEHEMGRLAIMALREPLHLEISTLFLKAKKNDLSALKFIEHLKELSLKGLL
jgi:DNA-binding transcriptional LysR family regulator